MKRDFSLLVGRHFDLLVCGGGIYGAWTAYDAALRGLRVAIVEQNDWASATSSASSKLIHGGLRYLESMDFRLVKKALTERRLLLNTAPHRVWPLRFGVPVYEDSRLNGFKLKAGLTLYDLLAGSIFSDYSHSSLDRGTFTRHFPDLSPTRLRGGFIYTDAQTDDARLVLELIAGAQAAGAVCVNYCKLTRLQEENGRACGAHVQDRVDGSEGRVEAALIVHTTGQWMAASGNGSAHCRLTKGVHLVMPGVLTDEALLLTAPSDGRVFFMIPWYNRTLLGTTDTDYHGDIAEIQAAPEDVAYLLAAANHYLAKPWTEEDIIGRFAGLRVLKHSDSRAPSSASRDWELKVAENGAYYSVGGKITSAREDASCIVDAVCASLGSNAPCATTGRQLPWAPQPDYAGWSSTVTRRATGMGLDQDSIRWLIRRHGTHAEIILDQIAAERHLAERIVPDLPLVYADLLYCAGSEMVVHLEDLLRRRMPLFILYRMTRHELQRIATAVAQRMDWTEARMMDEISACETWLHS